MLFNLFGPICAHLRNHEMAPNSAAAAAAGKVWRRRQPNFGRHAGAPVGFGQRQPENRRRRD